MCCGCSVYNEMISSASRPRASLTLQSVHAELSGVSGYQPSGGISDLKRFTFTSTLPDAPVLSQMRKIASLQMFSIRRRRLQSLQAQVWKVLMTRSSSLPTL